MRAFLVSTGRTIAPFGDRPEDSLFAASTVLSSLEASLSRRGISLTRLEADDAPPSFDEGSLVLADHTYLSDKCVGDFLALAQTREEPVRLALARTPSAEYTLPVSTIAVEHLDEREKEGLRRHRSRSDQLATERLAYDAFCVPKGYRVDAGNCSALLEHLRANAARVVVPKRELLREVRLPIVGDAERSRMSFPLTSTVACHLEHWVHVLWLNHLAFGIRWMELVRARRWWALWRILRAFPFGLPRLLSSFVHQGKGVRIHPTAHVEGSILGDGVTIGARASVRNSILGRGCSVGEHASVLTSVLGDDTHVTPKSFFVFGAAYPGAVISNYKMQMSLLGKGASSSTWAGLIDAKFQGAIDVAHRGQLVSTNRNFLGSCLGHGAHVGAKVLIMPGRAVPNETFIVMRPDELIRELPLSVRAGEAYARDQGTLVPLTSLLPPQRSPRESPASADGVPAEGETAGRPAMN